MSRIGKQPIIIPDNIDVKINDNLILVKGPRGELQETIHPDVSVEIKDKEIILKNNNNSAIWGTMRSLIFNLIKGVSDGFEKKLIYEGVGYKAILQGKKLVLSLGYSHPIEIEAPHGIEFKIEKNTITISGINKQLVGQVAADIRSKRKPEPYKGKGIRYENEIIRRKTGKKAAGSE
ncbi:50S ribosomal protein L6 [Patescibacteria group bacterium]|nr:50S ribosomal protein L6 [Patescibacteria group bacterium]